MSRKYSHYDDKFKFKVALEALKENKTVPELCREFELSAGQIYEWKKQLCEYGYETFSKKNKKHKEQENVEHLHAVIGKLKVENDFLARFVGRK
jgi:transposase-like protein